VLEPDARPGPEVRRGNDAPVERAGAAVKSNVKWRVSSDEQFGALQGDVDG